MPSLWWRVQPNIWNQNNKTALELGWFKQTNTVSGTDWKSLVKSHLGSCVDRRPSLLTMRPDFRFTPPISKRIKNEIDSWSFHDGKDHQISFGVQAEAWWKIPGCTLCSLFQGSLVMTKLRLTILTAITLSGCASQEVSIHNLARIIALRPNSI